jgi:hypothetical protein
LIIISKRIFIVYYKETFEFTSSPESLLGLRLTRSVIISLLVIGVLLVAFLLVDPKEKSTFLFALRFPARVEFFTLVRAILFHRKPVGKGLEQHNNLYV